MRYKSINEQNETFIKIIKQNSDLVTILDYIYELKLPNFYIAAGSVFQTIWNYYDNKPLNFGIKDIDIIYYDPINLSKESEQKLEKTIEDHFKKAGLNYELDIHNEARMHLWKKDNENKNIDQYKNSEDAIDQWIATVHAIGITKENNEIKVYAPYGLSDIFSKTIRPIKHKNNSKELYNKKVASWQKRFENLNIVEW
ncbi:MAG: nucleotidyltransferase family protein [Firmicutes bacterium]|nr:nucleotidyltransferase family protein [Bacillota bacterium]MDD7102265.1 nucleotidyltransferase family protein [Bacillota bacterium]